MGKARRQSFLSGAMILTATIGLAHTYHDLYHGTLSVGCYINFLLLL